MISQHETMQALELANQLYRYDPLTGLLHWKIGRVSATVGDVAGSSSRDYWVVELDGRDFMAHRVIWAIITGAWPNTFLDHEDRNKTNNRFENLRLADKSFNMQNIVKANSNSSTGVRGVSWNSRLQKFHVAIYANGRQNHLGDFDTLEEAADVRRNAKSIYHPGAIT